MVDANREPRLRVAVVGGSLGGLTAALLLRDLGCIVDVFERSGSRLSGFGAGIVAHEATMRYFVERERAQDRLSVRASSLRFVDAEGCVMHEEPSPYEFTYSRCTPKKSRAARLPCSKSFSASLRLMSGPMPPGIDGMPTVRTASDLVILPRSRVRMIPRSIARLSR